MKSGITVHLYTNEWYESVCQKVSMNGKQDKRSQSWPNKTE